MNVRYFAAAAEAAGVPEERRSETGLDALREALVSDHPSLGVILPRCAVLVDGVRTDADVSLVDAATVDILPPFAGG